MNLGLKERGLQEYNTLQFSVNVCWGEGGSPTGQQDHVIPGQEPSDLVFLRLTEELLSGRV